MAPVRRQFEAVLAQAVSAEIAGVSGSCADIDIRRRSGRSSSGAASNRPTTTLNARFAPSSSGASVRSARRARAAIDSPRT